MNWPQQAKVTQKVASSADIIRRGFNEAFDSAAIVASWEESHPNKDSMTPQMARDWSLTHVSAKRKPLELALSRTYANGWTLGDQIARSRLLGMGIRKSVSVGIIDWSTWTPGMSAAAALVKPPKGLQALIDADKIVIANDIITTKMDRIGTALATGLEKGYSAEKIKQMIDAVIDDPQHALTIARTEMNRAMSIATRNRYESANVEMVEWLVAEGCEDCQDNADASPLPIDQEFPSGDFEPPAHPNCMCALAPYFDDSNLPNNSEFESEE